MACRSVEAGLEARSEIARGTGESTSERKMVVEQLNLSSLSSVRGFAKVFSYSFGRLDLLVNNAGVMMIPDLRLTDDGYEEHWGVNYLSHYLLTSELFPSLRSTEEARIVNVSSAANSFGSLGNLEDLNYRDDYDPWQAYGNSKLGNLMFTFELDRRLKERGIANVTVNAVHPGLVKTKLGRYMSPLVTGIFKLLPDFFVLTPEKGARTQIDVAVSESLQGVSGKYFADQTMKLKPGQYAEEDVVISPMARDESLLRDLWDYSVRETQATWNGLQT
ncbi:short-chain dehydrogenase/reductase [Chloropicon primus]|uniref:Short-chain dehydrogenase/reductase n=2 Tax=Chloropicon primus TaxID=1764295 RepID=A0A5B8MTS6_9CHLO|nr:short-chain dehydrogenase/reductase [Chloropicon primus]UPR02960.1 short-chain dehydrogenase/reductase [Chloropicon primus]|eukprot:QDZ23747.1 short-chain dehydrogenase/reductase [Chloropicon primus]